MTCLDVHLKLLIFLLTKDDQVIDDDGDGDKVGDNDNNGDAVNDYFVLMMMMIMMME